MSMTGKPIISVNRGSRIFFLFTAYPAIDPFPERTALRFTVAADNNFEYGN